MAPEVITDPLREGNQKAYGGSRCTILTGEEKYLNGVGMAPGLRCLLRGKGRSRDGSQEKTESRTGAIINCELLQFYVPFKKGC